MEARAVVRMIQMSPRKMRAVVNTVRGEPVEVAVNSLRLMPKRAADVIRKAIESATANAEDKSGGTVDLDDLRVSEIYVDGGPIIKRWLPRAMGRANRINHRTSHLTVVLSDEE